jgi:hypothetical protein
LGSSAIGAAVTKRRNIGKAVKVPFGNFDPSLFLIRLASAGIS